MSKSRRQSLQHTEQRKEEKVYKPQANGRLSSSILKRGTGPKCKGLPAHHGHDRKSARHAADRLPSSTLRSAVSSAWNAATPIIIALRCETGLCNPMPVFMLCC